MGNDTKIKANTIAMIDNNKGIPLDEYLGNLSDLNTSDKSNLVNAINEIKTNNILTANMSNEQLTISANTNTKIPLKKSNSIGTQITLSSNIIKFSNNVKKVKVSATINAQIPSAGNVYGQLTVKDTSGNNLALSANTSNVDIYNFFEMNVTPKIINVENVEGIYLNAYLSRQGTAHEDEYGNCYVTVEVVE